MNLLKRLGSLLGGGQQASPLPSQRVSPPRMEEDEAEIVVSEISVETLRTALASAVPPLVIDVREPYEWQLVRMAEARHIPMNEVPAQLDTIARDREVVVVCAHGSRSYGVAAWLIEQGVSAASLAGGITQWASQGGSVEQG